jgi:hypothetical protein
MRKLVTIMNLMVKRGTKWSKTKKGDERENSSSPKLLDRRLTDWRLNYPSQELRPAEAR